MAAAPRNGGINVMTFLPIVERELRVATRRWNTYWLRVIAAGVALIIGGGMLLLSLLPFAGSMPGSAMFGTLTWLSLATALGSGLFFTSDCLSEEKREGTLGFLFLTDLRGYDVVLGKLFVTSLRSIFPLLAIFPILATTLLIGGVDVGHFWRAMLAIVNAAFFSLAVGMLVSSISRHSLKALAGTLLLLALFLGFGQLVDGLGALVSSGFKPRLSLASPGFAFVSANYARDFWPALMVSHGVGWLLLAAASFLVRRTWQEKPVSMQATRLSLNRVAPASTSARIRLRDAQLRDKNPVAWLAAREWGYALVVWLVAVVMLAAFLVLWLTGANALWHVWGGVNSLVSIGLYLWVAAKACQFFAEARRSGALELLLASPLSSREVVHGTWLGLLRLFAVPVLLLTCLHLALLLTGRQGSAGSDDFEWVQTVSIAVGALMAPANLIALTWFGLWMGLTSKNTLTATLKTLLYVQIIPWFAIYFLTAMIMPLFMIFGGGWPTTTQAGLSQPPMLVLWLPLLFMLVPALLGLLKNFFFWLGARNKLFRHFRELAMRSITPVHSGLPPVIKAP
ncbi:MAG TPA: ABC transporter permease subunit [Verrucomicrobiae bacterium]|nr:ABC transporter permease subunit [Verrucomicrobiae bacterium]